MYLSHIKIRRLAPFAASNPNPKYTPHTHNSLALFVHGVYLGLGLDPLDLGF